MLALSIGTFGLAFSMRNRSWGLAAAGLLLGLLLGVRLWYAFYGATLASNEAFESKMEELCRELGSRGEAILAPTDLGCGKPSSGLQLPRDGSGGKGRLASTMAAMVWLWRALQACGAGALLLILTRWTVKHRRA